MTESAPQSAWAPFRSRAFTILWCATIASNVGSWTHDTGAGWLMATLDPTPVLVSLVQAATTLPVFLFAILAGAISDLFDRRRLLLIVNILMALTAGILSILVATGAATPLILVVCTFLMGTGTAFAAPAWQAIVPSLVPRDTLQPAIALNSLGINISRAIGPALAGVLIVSVGLYAPFAVNAVSFVGIVLALLVWRPVHDDKSTLPREHMTDALRAGLRYAANSTPLRATLLRGFAFFLFASAYWALLPLIAKTLLGGDATFYGILVACIGAGAVFGALLLPKFRKRLQPNAMVIAGTFGTTLVLLLFAAAPVKPVAIAASFLAGLSWIIVLTTLNASAQTALPGWVRGRGLSIYITVFFGSMTAGSLIWGQIASHTSIPVALYTAAAGILLLLPLIRNAKLGQGEMMNLAPSMHWPAPIVAASDVEDRGPVATMITYIVPPSNQREFIDLMQNLGQARKRSGAYDWGLMQDAAAPDHFIEYFFEGSWLDHLRHHERVTGEDQEIQAKVRALMGDENAPVVQHLLGISSPNDLPSALTKGDGK
ncbi:MFS transporter [Sneathiella sp. HT1-7]|uniref:MFS transporter n=1 Tax=Sneathiella sp. HT1-7 TaxID=2887192 RepID=UPI001D15251A|nr:MFS transporter [Sneathiella sp. HT1-7]MCC3306209.1 MFS transporter [Sneathiella sp. HT1-7]